MEKEYIRETQRSVTLNVTAGKIDSFRELEKTTGTVRVYEGGCIGVAGCLGGPDEKELTRKAKEALSFGIPYPCRLEGPLALEDLREEEIIPVPRLIPRMQSFLDRLGQMCPKFAFSNKISLSHNRSEYRNSAGRSLVCAGRKISIELIVQSRGSGNLFDTALAWSGDHFDEEQLLADFKQQYDAFYTPAELPDGRYPVFGETSGLFGTFLQQFIGDLYAAGASLLSGKLGQKVFSDKLVLQDDMNPVSSPGVCIFDAEGCTAPEYRPALVDRGVLTGLLTTKKTAEQYGLPNLGTAQASYDGVPSLGFHGFYAGPTAKTMRDLAPGKAVLSVMASGGDTTPDGRFATPVQMAYLVENGRLAGRLPGLNISGNFFDMLGKDYLGAFRDDPLLKETMMCGVLMDVEKA